MNNRKIHTKNPFPGKIQSFSKIAISLGISLLLFFSFSLNAQVINNEGAVISVTGGTVVESHSIENTLDSITNDGVVNLTGDYINIGTTSGVGRFNIGGNWTNTGVFDPETGTVHFNGFNLQTITKMGGETFYNLSINNTGANPVNRVIISDNVTVTNSLTLDSGNVVTGLANILYLSNRERLSLNYLSTTNGRVIGKFQRGLNGTGNYLFPIGSDAYYNPLNLTLNTTPTEGSLLSEFFMSDPGGGVFPLEDDSAEIFDLYPDGYWSLIPYDDFESLNYDINMKGAGFSDTIHNITTVIKRDIGGDWELEGEYIDASESDSVAYRTNIDDGFNDNGNGFHFAFGHSRPKITDQPEDTSVCDQTPAWFEVKARGRKQLTYQWQLDDGTGMTNISDGPVYTGTKTAILHIPVADLSMDGYQYRVIIHHNRRRHEKISDTVTLSVNPIPEAFATPDRQILCNGEPTNIALTSSVPFSTFILEIVSSGAITGWESLDVAGGNFINHTLTNPGSDLDSIIYRIIPFGPEYTYCQGVADTAVILVNPTPTIIAYTLDTLYCNSTEVFLKIENEQNTTGTIKYNLTTTDTDDDFIGETTTASGWLPGIDDFSDILSHGEPTIQQLSYRFTPYIEDAYGMTDCGNGIDTAVIVKMVPVLTGLAVPDTYIGGDNIRCNSLSDGKIGLTPTGGDYRFEYDFVWENVIGDTLQRGWNTPIDSLDNQAAGSYNYSITDTIGCNVTGSFVLIEPDTLALTVELNQPLCVGSPTGSVYYVVAGGNEAYSYYWKNLNTWVEGATDSIFNAEKGEYYFEVEDINGCIYEDTSFLPAPADLYSQISDRSSNLWGGIYDIRCVDELGYIEVKGIGGAEPYTYEWFEDGDLVNPISTNDLLSDITAGTYHYFIQDDNGCEDRDGIKTVVITEPDSIKFEKMNEPYPGDWDISCFGLSDGALEMKYTGGHLVDYTDNVYTWTESDGGSGIVAGDSLQSGLTAGRYTVNVTDHYGCTADYIDTLIQPEQLQFTVRLSDYFGRNIACYGDENGSIQLDTIFGGDTVFNTGGYLFDWTPPTGFSITDPSLQDQDNLIAGMYELLITDQIGCDTTTFIELLEPDELLADTIIVRTGDKNGYSIRCFGFNDGEISIVPEGGTRPFTYDWNGIGTVDEDTLQQDLFAGDEYSVTIMDVNNCAKEYEFVLASPDQIELSAAPGFIECFNGADTIFLTPSGGNIEVSDAYQYDWEIDGRTTQDLENMVAGIYTVTVTDDNNCVKIDSFELEQSTQIIPAIDITTDNNGQTEISCYGASDAIVQVYVEGGLPGYTYNWSTGVSGSTFIENIPSGTYTVSGVDQYGCPYSIDTTVVDPPLLVLDYDSINPLCNGVADGEISLVPIGGTPSPAGAAYIFDWEHDPVLRSGEALGLSEGNYYVKISDVNNCEVDTTIRLTEPESLILEFETTMAECRDEANGTITITETSGGVGPYRIEMNGYEGTFYDYLKPGEYLIILTDAQNCILEDTAIVLPESESCLGLPNAFTPNGDGSNDTWVLDEDEDGSTDMIYYPLAELRIYNRWGELLYYTNNVVEEPWDGTYKGRDMPIDSYHYILDLNNGDPPFTGNVTIIR